MMGLWTKLPTPDWGGFDVRQDSASGRFSLRGFLKACLFAVLSLVAVLLAGFGAFAWHVSGLETPAEPRPADAIIVLTGGQSRLDTAVNLLKSGKGQRLLISGVNPIAGQADLIRASGGDETLFSCCVDLDRAALDTIGNAQESAKWMRDHAYGSVILVTNNYHIPRTMLEMKRLLGSADLQAYPVVNTPLDSGQWLVKPDALRVLVTEYSKFLAAVVRGVFTDAPQDEAEAHPAIAQAAG
jgi:uncharacterized SAM-binding protein YcdF (DUF218 family)